jgi:hypothetical protein
MAKKFLWLGRDDKVDFVKSSNRAVAVTLDGSAAAAAGVQLPFVLKNTQTLDPGSIAVDDQLELSVTVSGAIVGDGVIVIPPVGLNTGLMAFAFVSATDTLKLRLLNSTAGAIDPASASWTFLIVKAV